MIMKKTQKIDRKKYPLCMLYDDMYIYDPPYYWTELLDVF